MAHMYPEDGPAYGTKSEAEVNVYKALKRKLSDDYYVFHSKHWENDEKNDHVTNGELDFIIVHRELGVILLEVKGGYISREKGEWYNINRFGEKHHLQPDPINQVKNSARALKNNVRTKPSTAAYANEYFFSYGVWFSSDFWEKGKVEALDFTDEIVLDRDDLDRPEEGIRRIVQRYHKKRRTLSEEAIKAITNLIAPTGEVRSPLAKRLQADDKVIEQLTSEQIAKLDQLARHRRLAIRGSAGTGKTVLAIEKMHRLAASNLDVLYLCKSSFLSSWVESLRNREPEDIVKQHITVHHLLDLCNKMAESVGIAEHIESLVNPQQVVRMLRKSFAAQEIAIRYDAVIVDEGQDINDSVWPQLLRLLGDPKEGLFYVFYDPAQSDDKLKADWTPPIGANAKSKY